MKTTRIILTVAVLFAALILPEAAMATKGSCAVDPTIGFNEETLAKGNGAIQVDVQFGWDNVSVFPTCDGPLFNAHVTNTTSGANAQTWYAVFPRPHRPHGNPIVITMGPGFDQTYTAQQLSAVGLSSFSDIDAFDLTQTNPLG